MIVHHTEGK